MGTGKIEPGTKYNRLTFMRFVPKTDRYRRGMFKCDCGVTKEMRIARVMSGGSKSCGCFNVRHYKHGHTANRGASSIYAAWQSMHQRCLNSNHKSYAGYGGRGIAVSPEWDSFQTFMEDMGKCPVGLSLDRIDNNKGYCKSNCRWASITEQNNNTRANVFLEMDGLRLTLTEWSRRLGIPMSTIGSRIMYGKTTEQILSVVPLWKRGLLSEPDKAPLL